jgi:hypothetical protein
MEATAARPEAMSSMHESDLVYEVIKGAGKVGGYLHHFLTDMMYYAGKTVAHVRGICSGFRDSLNEGSGKEAKITILRLIRNDAAIDEADKRELYMSFGRDMVELTKAGVESENLTVIDLSKYGI